MNVYRVWLDSEKHGEWAQSYIYEATAAHIAISKAARKSIHCTANELHASTELLAKNMTYREYKARQEAAK